MTPLDTLFILSACTLAVAWAFGRRPAAGGLIAVLYGGQILALAKMSGLASGALTMIAASPSFEVLGQALSWRFDGPAWFFALITLGAAFASAWFMAGEWGEGYRRKGGRLGLLQVALALNVSSMLLLLASGDLLSLFIGWELMSWASFLLMLSAGGVAVRWAFKYLIYALGGAMALLGALAWIHAQAGSLQYAAVAGLFATLSPGQAWTLVLAFAAGFGIKMALLPFHLWQGPAYAETPGPGSAFLGAISSRMGLFGILVVLVHLAGLDLLDRLLIPFTHLDARDLLGWVGAFTLIVPTFIAVRQHDARHLLAWHGIGQGGYMLIGVMQGDALGSAGGLLHVFNYATYQAALFLVVTAVVHRTGTADLNKLGGLVTRMPLSFLVMLVGIIGLAGLPPMNGFVSKWLIYRDLISSGRPLMFVATVIGTLGTIISVYKLIHNTFLGQLRMEHEDIREAPWSMLAPMLGLIVLVFLTGLMPGLVLDWIAPVQAALGLPVLDHSLGGVDLPNGGLDMLWVVGLLFAGFGVGALLFLAGNRHRYVHPLDNYAGGHFLTTEVRYHYSDDFYPGLMHLIGGWYRGSIQWLERALVSALDFLAQWSQAWFRSAQPALWLLGVTVFALWWVV